MDETTSPPQPPDAAAPAERSAGRSGGPRGLELRLGRNTTMILLAVVIGVMAGLAAVVFRWLIAGGQDIGWGSGGTFLDRVLAAPWYWRLGIPTIGGLVVGLIVRFMAPEAKGHGVPEVMEAVARKDGVIRPVVAVGKSLASAVCIASGGSVGREGPIVQIGSAAASSLGQLLGISGERLRICVACGAAGGIAATFNAPVAGAFFAAEIIIGGFHALAFGPVVISSVVATVVSRSLLGDVPAFEIPRYALESPAEMLTYAVLGLLAGMVALAFIRVLETAEDLFDDVILLPPVLKPALGGLMIGGIALVVPQVMGIGYETITQALRGELLPTVLFAVLGAKLVATCLTLGSGGSGGIFAPSLLMGAALGGGVGHLAAGVAPFPMASPGAYAVVGMGAVVAAATHAPITAIVMIFELTGDYRVILGLMLSCILSTLFAQRLSRASIYTVKLLRRGVDLEAGQELNVLRELSVGGIVRPSIELIPRHAGLEELSRRMVESPHYEFFTVDEGGHLVGVISIDDLRHSLPQLEELGPLAVADDLALDEVLYVREDDTLDLAMRQFGKRMHEELPVLPAGTSMVPVGSIQRQDVINAYNKEILRRDVGGALSSRLDEALRHRTWETVGGYVLSHLPVPAKLWGRALRDLELPQRYGIQLILIDRQHRRGEERYEMPEPATILREGDWMVAFGQQDAVRRLQDAPR